MDSLFWVCASFLITGLLEKPYWLEYKPFRQQTHKFVTSKYFDLAISAIIGINVITMAMEFYMMPKVLVFCLRHIILVFLVFGPSLKHMQLLLHCHISM